MKGPLSNKTKLEEACTVTMNERCSAVLLNKLPSKEKDPGSFTIPCDIGHLHINNALADLGANQSIKRSPAEDDECYGIDYLDITIHSKTHELLEDDQLDPCMVNNLEKIIDQSDLESCGKTDNGSESETPIRRIEQANTPYSESQETKGQNEHLYSTSANEIDEKDQN
ncbi:hypothetical protein Tco_1168063 [Tanacetum coccineum]